MEMLYVYTQILLSSFWFVLMFLFIVVMLWGGQTKPHADAQEDSWEKILAFLQQHLYYFFPQAKL